MSMHHHEGERAHHRDWLQHQVENRGAMIGYSGSFSSTVGNTMLRVNAEPWDAQRWTVTLLAMRFAGGVVPANPLGLPTDNLVQQFCQVQLQWGVGGAMELALLDYPWAGSTFEITAAQLTVNLAPTVLASSGNPNVGAFMSPVGRDTGADVMLPTCVSGGFSIIGAAGTLNFPVPARARAYTLEIASVGAQPSSVGVSQFSGGPSNVFWGPSNAGVKPLYYNVSHAQLDPWATALQVVNFDGVVTAAIRILWYLDLG